MLQLVGYAHDFFSVCCDLMAEAAKSPGQDRLADSIVQCSLPVFLLTLQCFAESVYLACSLLSRLKRTLQVWSVSMYLSVYM